VGHIPVRTVSVAPACGTIRDVVDPARSLTGHHSHRPGMGDCRSVSILLAHTRKGNDLRLTFLFLADGMWEQSVLVKKWSVAITGSTVSSDPRFAGYSHLMLRFHSFPALLHGWYSVYGQNELIIPPTGPSPTGTQSTTSIMTGCTSW
jgi:hypothetical protein